MDRPDLIERILGYLDGELSPEEEVRLAAELKESQEGRDWLLRLARMHARMPEALRLVEGSEKVRAAQAQASGDSSRPRRKTDRWGRRENRRSGPAWNPVFLAIASVAAVVLVVFLAAPRGSAPGQPVRGPARDPQASRIEAPAPEAAAERDGHQLKRDLKRAEEDLHRADREKREEDRQRAERELARIRDEHRALVERSKAAAGPTSDPRPADPPAVKPEPPKQEPPAPRTLSSLATVERVEGDVVAVFEGKKEALKAGDAVLAGHGLEAGPGARLTLIYPDTTRLEVGPDSILRELSDKGGKDGLGNWVHIERGSLRAQIAKQPKDRAMGFGTPQAEARILGTTIRIKVDPDPAKGATRLEVTEGKVKLTRLHDRMSREVLSGHFAVAAVGTVFTAKRLPVDEILLIPSQESVKIVGKEWQLLKDDDGAGGHVLETSGHSGPKEGSYLKLRPSYVTFSFWADADKEYQIWVRGWAMSTQDRPRQDAVLLEPGKGTFTRPCPYVSSTSGENGACFDGFCEYPGYGWIGGCVNPQKNNESVPAVVRFARTELQTLKLYSDEGRMRVSAIWLSSTQKTRPSESQRGPDPQK